MRILLVPAAAVLALIAVDARAGEVNTLCRMLKTQTGITGAAYQPGVDARGRPVVPADVNAPIAIPTDTTIHMPLTVDLAQRVQAPLGTKMEANLGTLDIDAEGYVTYNGQDLTPRSYAICGLEPPKPLAPAPAQQQEATAPPMPATPPQTQPQPVQAPAQEKFAPMEGSPSKATLETYPENYGTPPGAVLSSEEGGVAPPAALEKQGTSPYRKSTVVPEVTDMGSSRRDDIIWGQGN